MNFRIYLLEDNDHWRLTFPHELSRKMDQTNQRISMTRTIDQRGCSVRRSENGMTTICIFYDNPSTIQHEAQVAFPAQISHFAKDLTPCQIREMIDQVLDPTTRRFSHHFENPI